MTLGLAALNLVLGTVYSCYGLMTIVDLRRGWPTRGYSHFGFAWLAMAFTCGPHHLDHGLHLLAGGRPGGVLDVVAVVVGVPAGVTWFLLRVEAMIGGRGDRFLARTPKWLELVPLVGAVYVAALATALGEVVRAESFDVRILPNLLLLGLYGAIGAVLASTQVRNHLVTDGWSLSGTALSAVMFTCGLMHVVYAAYATAGTYDIDIHGLTIDVLSVPAAIYFLWVVVALHKGTLRDWNESPAEPGSPAITTSPRSTREDDDTAVGGVIPGEADPAQVGATM